MKEPQRHDFEIFIRVSRVYPFYSIVWLAVLESAYPFDWQWTLWLLSESQHLWYKLPDRPRLDLFLSPLFCSTDLLVYLCIPNAKVLITVVYSQSWKQAGRSFNLAPFISIFFPPILCNLQKFWNWLADSYPRYNHRDFGWCYVASVDRFEGKATLTIVFRPMNVACLSICSGLLCHSWQCL